MTASFTSQMKALLWRNVLLKKRNKKQLSQEIFFPIYFVLIIAIIKMTVKPTTYPPITSFPSYNLNESQYMPNSSKVILVSPDNPEVRTIMDGASQYVGGLSINYTTNQSSAELIYKNNPHLVAAGVVFNSWGENPSYAIRTSYQATPVAGSLFKDQGQCRNANNGSNASQCTVNMYLTSGFLWLQRAVEAALIKRNASGFSLPEIFLNMMPKGEFSTSLIVVQSIASVYFVMAYSPFINFLSVNLVAEKEKKIREGMKMMGLRDSVFWLSWGFTYFVLILVVTIVITILVFAFSFFSRQSNLFIYFLLILFYGMSIINLACMLTPFFKKAQTAGGLTSFATILVACLYFAVSMTRTQGLGGYVYSVPIPVIWILCLLSPVALALGIDQGIYLDNARGGMTFGNMSYGDFPLHAPLVMLVVDIFLYGLLAVYLDHVVPGEYGPRYPPWYFLMPSYYCQQSTTDSELSSLVQNDHQEGSPEWNSPDIEPVSPDLKDKATLRIFNISKHFRGKEGIVQAVRGLTLDMYEGQITALLGHNGAGKTTLINMLCGLTPPTKGTASILGMDVSNSGDIERLRSMCGVCPQHNILYDDLTVAEHLKIFAGIKGVPQQRHEAEVTRAMKEADISEKSDTMAKNLSGGQKRKLSVAMALIGDPKVVFLDEPTAGMDPYSRRHLWSLLKNNKEGRIILLTTHFMDEADILADRKAIINHGTLRCCGSSLFLKNRFGLGYHLNMVVEPDCNSDKVTEVLNKQVDGVEMRRTHAKELAYTLPLTEVHNFSHMFSTLEERLGEKSRAEALGIKSYGVSMTTLEEVFLKLGDDIDENGAVPNGKTSFENPIFNLDRNATPSVNSDADVSIEMKENSHDPTQTEANQPKVTNLTKHRFLALLQIRFLLYKRSPLAYIFMVILPIGLVVGGLMLARGGNNTANVSNPVPQSFSAALSSYVANATGIPKATPLVVVNSQGDASSKLFVSNVSQDYKVDEVNGSVNLMNVAPHFLGFNLEDWQGATTYGINYTVMYNDSAVHSLPAVVNMMSNILYRVVTGGTGYISGSSLAWPSTSPALTYNYQAFIAAMLIGMAFVMITPGFAVNIVQDRQLKARSQLRIAGVTFNLYWGSLFFINMCIILVPAIICLIIIAAVKLEPLNNAGAFLTLVLVFLTNLPCNLLFAFVISFGFDQYETCQAVLPNVLNFLSILPYVAVSLVDMLANNAAARAIHIVMVIVNPTYPLVGGIYFIYRVWLIASITNQLNVSISSYFNVEIVLSFVMPLVHICILYWLLRIFDVRSTGGNAKEAIKCGGKSKVENIPEENHDVIEDEDEDVKEERNRVASLDGNPQSPDAPVAYVQNLRKQFKKDNASVFDSCRKVPKKDTIKVAVRNAAFAVERGEVFGLLGPNGAGKTTTLNMMTAETGASRGKVMVGGYDVRSSLSEAFQAMGYCAQHDALWELLTLREHIELYGMIRGLTTQDAATVATGMIDCLKVEEHEKKAAKKLSGGTKRKLSYAISMLASPDIVLLDEPSTGMDPQSKRFLWDTISQNFSGNSRGAILTTHYMEEADALCSRLAIMVNGKIECLGPSQHLKDKYGSGYLLEVKLKRTASSDDMEERMNALERHLASLFPESKCLERFEERGQYKIPRSNVKSLAQTFSSLEDTKRTHDMEEYSFSQSTLEQVFLDFAKRQHEEGDDPTDFNGKKMERQLSDQGYSIKM